MRKLLLLGLVAVGLCTGCAHASFILPQDQTLEPTLLVDEQLISYLPYQRVPYPDISWSQARACLRILGNTIPDTIPMPDLIVVPFHYLGAHDLTRDSIFAYDPYYSPVVGPIIAYSFLKANVVVIVQRYASNPLVLRHEAIHFMLWHANRAYGHDPPGLYQQCADNYESVIAEWAP